MARIIIEGQNGVGKTTLAEFLAKQLKYKYVKDDRAKQERDGFKLYHRLMYEYSNYSILDRFHVGEYVYPRLYQDGRKGLELWQMHLLERSMIALRYILIYVQASNVFIANTYKTRGEKSTTLEQVPAERALFQQAISYSLLPIIYFNPEHDKLNDAFVHKVLDAITISNLKYDFYSKMGSTGNIYPNRSIMLIGERMNPNRLAANKINQAFADTCYSSAFLHRAIEARMYGSIYITNAFKKPSMRDNVSLLFQELDYVRPQRIVTLGRKADLFLNSLNITHETAMHPQAVSRFRLKSLEAYARDLIGG